MNGLTVSDSRADHRCQLLVELVNIPSVSHQEHRLADWVDARLRRCRRGEVVRAADEVAFRFPALTGKPKVILCGHLDTVPPNDNQTARVEGDRVYGLGSTDLKAGLAVFLDLVETLDPSALQVDPVFLFYTREEVAYNQSGLLVVERELPDLLDDTRFAICVEPTENAVELGCLGNLHAEVTVHGKAAHSARPWFGDNAIHTAAPLIERIAAVPERPVVFGDQVVYREVIGATTIAGGGARNVIPDAVTVNLNFRFAPDRSGDEAVAWIGELVGDAGTVEITDLSPAGRVASDNPLCQGLVDAAGGVVRAKQAWTDVGRFSAWGIDAVSCGPGIPAQAHQKTEYATISAMTQSAALFERFLRDAGESV
jgi:succinyl-diaminopimelate desuccinylase